MRALVISGGSSKGAFAGGVAEYLMRKQGKQYDIFVGTSTGGLLTPLLAIDKIEKLKEVYSNVSNDDIFKISPMKVRYKNGQKVVGIHHLNVLRMFLKGEKTFGDSSKLKDLIYRTFSLQDYEAAKQSGKTVIITVANLSLNLIEYKYLNDCTYEEFVDWMWIGSNVVPFMSLCERDGFEYADGGFGNIIPVKEAINKGATDIDVIVLHPKFQLEISSPIRNAFQATFKTFDFMLRQLGSNDVYTSYLESVKYGINLNYYYTPRLLSSNYFLFDKNLMAQWWEEGYNWAKKKSSHHF